MIKVLAVSSYNDRSYVQGMMENGASGYITKEEAPELLVEAVHKAYKSTGKWVSPRARKYYSVERERPPKNKTSSRMDTE